MIASTIGIVRLFWGSAAEHKRSSEYKRNSPISRQGYFYASTIVYRFGVLGVKIFYMIIEKLKLKIFTNCEEYYFYELIKF